jgi:hypothetical protein
MGMVINIRSTNGGGKSSIVTTILDVYKGEPILDDKGKIRGYLCKDMLIPGMARPKDLRILGNYSTQCGGCDGIPTQDQICDLVREWAPLGNVLYEGLLISGLFSRYNSLTDELQSKFGTHSIIGFLDTPLQTCIERTLSRRAKAAAAKGKTPKEFDPYKTLAPKFEAILSSRKKFELAGTDKCECCKIKPCQSKTKDVRTIPYKQAVSTVLGWIRDEAEETTEAQE